jgi:hypothetical protein
MVEQETCVTKKELEGFMMQIEGIKSTIEILQNKEAMKQIEESERLEKEGAESFEIKI